MLCAHAAKGDGVDEKRITTLVPTPSTFGYENGSVDLRVNLEPESAKLRLHKTTRWPNRV